MQNYHNEVALLIRNQDYQAILDQDGWETLELTINDRHPPLVCSMIITELKLRQLDLFEIYVYNDFDIDEGCYEGKKAGEVSVWDTRWVLGTDEGIKTFPWFDCIISKNDNSTGRRTGAIIWR